MFKKNILLTTSIVLVAGCSSYPSFNVGESSIKGKTLPEYVAISPISLPPIAPDIKTGLREISDNVEGTKAIPYDMDLLVLPTTLSKVQYDFFNIDTSGSAGIASASGGKERSKAIYDLMHMASHPLPVVLKPMENQNEEVTIIVTPFVGVGVRVIAEYVLKKGKGNLSLPALAAALEANDGSGSIEIQQLGISRYGSSNQGVTGIDLTPDNLETALKSIGYMMGQIWLMDTRVQPMIVGYSVPGYSNISAKYHPYIVDQLISRKTEILQPFVESMFYEAQEAFGISGELKPKNGVETNYNIKLSGLKKIVERDRVRANTYAEVALIAPDRLPEVTPFLVDSYVRDETTNPVEAVNKILLELNSKKPLKDINDK